jgi:hypothetical protein
MKVDIGPYKRHLTTYRTKCNYLELRYGQDWYTVEKSDYTWIDRIVVGFLRSIDYCLKPFNTFLGNRKVEIKYDSYDTWSLDHTLSLIILPGLKQLKATNHGYASVDNEDLPTACLEDASGEERWEWVMDEMIWAFDEIANDYPGKDAFCSGNRDVIWTKVDINGDEDPEGTYSRMDKGPNDTFYLDFEGQKKYDDRIQRGLILFGKYYRNLWD